MLVVSGVALLGGGAAAVAATHGSTGHGARAYSSRQAYLGDVARHLNVSPGALSAAIKAADVERIEAALAAGRLSQSQAAALKQRIQRAGSAPFFATRLGGAGGVGAAARYLGIAPATLHAERRAGRSLAEIAASTPGKSVAGLEAALTEAQKARLADAVSSGLITARQEQKRLSHLSSRIEAMIKRTALGGASGASGSASQTP